MDGHNEDILLGFSKYISIIQWIISTLDDGICKYFKPNWIVLDKMIKEEECYYNINNRNYYWILIKKNNIILIQIIVTMHGTGTYN